MDEALLALLEKKEFAYITIRELCAAAGVNRSTFYLHYQNMTELLEESIAYMNRQFYECFPFTRLSGAVPDLCKGAPAAVSDRPAAVRRAALRGAVPLSVSGGVFAVYGAAWHPGAGAALHDTVLSARNFSHCRAVAGAGLPGAGGRYHRDDFAVYAHRGSHIETPARSIPGRRCGHLRSFFWFFCSLGSF